MHFRPTSFIIAVVSLLMAWTPACEPTSPDRAASTPKTRTSAKQAASATVRPETDGRTPSGHLAKPLTFAVAAGDEGASCQKPTGVWTRFGNDLRILQDPAPGEGSAPPAVTTPPVFSDDFDRADLGADWRIQAGNYRIRDGVLYSDIARNHNVFLQKSLPRNVRIEFDARSETNRIDVKVSLYDDGKQHETGYVVLMGGWHNAADLLIRGREHDHESVARRSVPGMQGRWQAGRTYHWTIIRQGSTLTWYVDNKLHLVYDDPAPLWGDANRYFSISNWESRVYLDNLKIYDLGG